MKDALAVGAGGFFGCIARYLTGLMVLRLLPDVAFPFATLTVNVAGCLLIGLLGGLAEDRALLSPPAQLFLLVGFLGGFTTYSAFAYQTLALYRAGSILLAALNVSAQLVLGLSAVWLGGLMSRHV